MKKNLIILGALCAMTALVSLVRPVAAESTHKLELLTQEYWIWAFNEPPGETPLEGSAPFCRQSDSGNATFLAGTWVPGVNERSCRVDRGQTLFLSILSSLYIAFESDPAETKTAEAMLDFARCPDATATVTVDGKTFDATDSYLETEVFDFPVSEGGLLEALLGGEQTDGAVVAGIHVLLPPLTPGDHTVSWHAETLDCGYDADGDGVVDPLVKDLVYSIHVD
ncbi:MAG: hypothetical protein OEZ06_17135 [Myxococcales bacterium]|nr:hypothetical protein [Myxococcales bacterium]